MTWTRLAGILKKPATPPTLPSLRAFADFRKARKCKRVRTDRGGGGEEKFRHHHKRSPLVSGTCHITLSRFVKYGSVFSDVVFSTARTYFCVIFANVDYSRFRYDFCLFMLSFDFISFYNPKNELF